MCKGINPLLTYTKVAAQCASHGLLVRWLALLQGRQAVRVCSPSFTLFMTASGIATHSKSKRNEAKQSNRYLYVCATERMHI